MQQLWILKRRESKLLMRFFYKKLKVLHRKEMALVERDRRN